MYNYRKYGTENNAVHFAANMNDDSLFGSTLIIGQNNAGKTSIVSALKKASGNEEFKATDFNFSYLMDLLKTFFDNLEKIKDYINGEDISDHTREIIHFIIPSMKFVFEFQLDCSDGSNELLTNIAPLIHNDIGDDGIITVCVQWEVKEEQSFLSTLYDAFSSTRFSDEKQKADAFYEYLRFLSSNNLFCKMFYTDDTCKERVTDNFKIQNLIQVETISFESLHTAGRLSAAFNKIYKFKAKNDPDAKKSFENQVREINTKIEESTKLMQSLTERVNKSFEKTMDREHASMRLRSNLTVDNLLTNGIRYVYHDGKFEIPEDQFGMGYTNLMLIIAQLVDYVDDSPETDFRNKINLLLIEEPESYMHPQMQRVLIKNLDDAVRTILEDKNSKIRINCQLIITSHSSNIVYGKLHTEDTFNNINYIFSHLSDPSEIVPLEDKDIAPGDGSSKVSFNFLKKHIQYNSCELFFADACVVVEGYSEATILPYYVDNNESLQRKYITIFSINGAYAQLYLKLFKALRIPVAVITDLDLVQSNQNNSKSDSDENIVSLADLTTSNNVLKHYLNINKYELGAIPEIADENVHIFTQSKTEDGVYPTSFEEALILANPDNNILQQSLRETIPGICKGICNSAGSNVFKENAHKLLNALERNNKKGQFATRYLFNILISKQGDTVDEIPVLPDYIARALYYIKSEFENAGRTNDQGINRSLDAQTGKEV